MEKEIWKACKGFEQFYEVSNLGRVRSIALFSARWKKVVPRKNPVLKELETSRFGYKRVLLCLYGVHYHCAVHRLVAQTFLPNVAGYPEVNHKDENKGNNHVSNLEWCSRKYNANYGSLPERISDRMSNHHPAAMRVFQFDLNGNFIREWKSQRQAGRAIGIDGTTIGRCIQGKYKHAGGFIWKSSRI